jgi:hypothetical protein
LHSGSSHRDEQPPPPRGGGKGWESAPGGTGAWKGKRVEPGEMSAQNRVSAPDLRGSGRISGTPWARWLDRRRRRACIWRRVGCAGLGQAIHRAALHPRRRRAEHLLVHAVAAVQRRGAERLTILTDPDRSGFLRAQRRSANGQGAFGRGAPAACSAALRGQAKSHTCLNLGTCESKIGASPEFPGPAENIPDGSIEFPARPN